MALGADPLSSLLTLGADPLSSLLMIALNFRGPEPPICDVVLEIPVVDGGLLLLNTEFRVQK
jgi:hypothetical protein